ncbi:amino acid adenylation domain-containing protein [Plantactinospora sp. BB1]|uniref:amino acid adenylation domain-containing protein n=1 Tax=Plantactinospora sp. BB1 TaxID=2071627 RepID=UPI000D17B5DE|nr:non-ribosomal peptide synthetase [Plantactinospora sp. BB1]AVT35245.1 hypothetical protein C6W10_00805 [Plantactinospora sp. BB1]
MTELSSRIDGLSPRRRALLEQLRRERSDAVRRRPEGTVAPLSSAQQRMWFLDQYDAGSAVYNVYVVVRLSGRLDRDALAEAVSGVARRHEILRTVYPSRDGRAEQVVLAAEPVPLPVRDLTGRPAAERYEAALAEAVAEARVPFDLRNGPLLRAALLRIDADDHLFVLTMHHIAADGWSMGVLVQEVATGYASAVAGETAALPEPPIQYADYAQWQRDRLGSGALEAGLAYWRERLTGASAPVELPADRSRPPVRGDRGRRHLFSLDPELVAQVRRLCRAHDVTLFMALLAAFTALLVRYTSRADVPVGTPIANRTRPEFEGLIGFFVNTLVLRTELDGNPTFREILHRVREVTLGAYEHQEVPFERLVEELRPDRDPGHTPLFQVMFVLQNAPLPPVTVPGLTMGVVDVHNDTAKFDLTLVMTELGDRVEGWLEYATDLFDDATAQRIAGHYRTLLAGAVAAPERRLWELPVLDADTRRRMVREWNRTGTPPSTVTAVHQRIAALAAAEPDRIAVVGAELRLRYRELDRRANALAHRLRERGVGPDVPVGVCLERSVDLVLTLLAVHRAGGAYLPLDPDLPRQRLDYLLDDAGAATVVARPDHPLAATAAALVLPYGWAATAPEADAPPAGEVTGDHLGYVIYTSGTTGQPKGVASTHRGMVNRLEWMAAEYPLTGADRILQKTPASFDVSVWEFFWPLMAGAGIVVARPGGHRDPGYLAELIVDERVTVVHFVPSMLRAFLDHPDAARCTGLRHVVCSGEALAPDLVARFYEVLPGSRLHNLYGPTEASIDVTAWACRPEDSAGTVPIGRPIANTRTYVLDPWLNPVPVGVPGELYLAGIGLARGYLNRPALTAERFVPDPFGTEPGGRLYRTGDRARYRPDGAIEYLDRMDRQVKIRGLRVEPGEIEAALHTHPSIARAAVVARTEPAAPARLVGYVVAAGLPPSVADLRGHLLDRLPEHMVPATFVFLESLPLTRSGKVDRAALPEPDDTRPEIGEFVAPAGPVEEALARIWSDLLRLDRVGAGDSFFALGGDSIRSIQMLSRAREEAGLDLSLRQVFAEPTIRALARAGRPGAERGPVTAAGEPFALLAEADRGRLPEDVVDAYPLSVLQHGMIFDNEYRSDFSIYHDVFGFHLRGPFDATALDTAVARLVARHPVLRTSIDLAGYAEPLQLVWRQGRVPVRVADLRGLDPAAQRERIAAWTDAEKVRPFDWTVPALLRVQVHRLGDDEFWFSLSCSNTILDGWSVSTLLTELFRAYDAELTGATAAEPPAPRSTFRDFVAAERACLDDEETRRLWRERLADAVATPLPRWPRPADAPAGPDGGRRQRRVRAVPVDEPVETGLRRLARGTGVPLKSVLVAAHLKVVAVLAGHDRAVTGMVTNGRLEEPDADRVLGLFLNVVPLVADLSGGDWTAVVRQVFDTERALLPHRRYPATRLRPAVGQEWFETAVNFVNFHVYDALGDLGALELLGVDTFDDTNFPLWTEFSVNPRSGRIELELSYDAAVLADEQVGAIGGYYAAVLAAMAADPSSRPDRVDLLPAASREWLLSEVAGDRAADVVAEGSVFERLTAVVESTGPAVALLDDSGVSVTFAEVAELAGRLAGVLRSAGVVRESAVGVCVPRGVDLPVVVLAVWWAGGVYVPLDPSLPAGRLAEMTETAGVSVLVSAVEGSGVPGFAAPVIDVSGGVAALVSGSAVGGSVVAPVVPVVGHGAFVVFTSGSTGRPKGVVVEHGQLWNRLVWMWEGFGFGVGEVVCQKTSVGFVDSVWELVGGLLAGVRSVVVSDEVSRDPLRLVDVLGRERVTRLWLVPSLLRAVLDAVPDLGARLPELRMWVSSGEALPWSLWHRFQSAMPHARLFNLYGTSEIWDATWHDPYASPVPPVAASVPIGRPIRGVRVYVLDGVGGLVPVGVPGELWVGGVGVSRGYLGEPVLTADRFRPDPFGLVGARMYRTGDLACVLPDGQVQFLGRVDHQVKVRGVRVEPAEVEAALERHPGVRQAVVVARDTGTDEPYLAAYLVPEPGRTLDPTEVRHTAATDLPAQLRPARVAVLTDLPLTSSGKVDRLALPEIAADANPGGPYTPPRDPVESTLAAVWAEVLGRDRIGVDDNFFDLGGDSLRAVRIVARSRHRLGVDVPVAAVFQAPTVAQLRRWIADSATPAAPVPQQPDDTGPAPLSFAQQRLWFLHQADPGSAAYNVHFAVRIRGPLDVAALRHAVREVIRRHEPLRTTFAVLDGVPAQVVRPAPDDPLTVAVAPAGAEADLRTAVHEEIHRPFDLDRGPVLRATLLRTAPDEHVALLVLHHVACDAWSMPVLLRELAALYTAARAGRPDPLGPPPVPYREHARRQRVAYSGDRLAARLDYWRERLADAPDTADRLIDRPRPAHPGYAGGTESTTLARPLGAGVRDLATASRATVFMCLLASFAVVLHARTGAEDVLIGTDLAGRDDPGLDGLVGFFVNQMPVRTDLSGDPTFRELLGRVRDDFLRDQAREVPFDRLVEAVGGERDLSRAPVFQLKLVHHDVPDDLFSLPDLRVTELPVHRDTTQLDLNLRVTGSGDELRLSAEYDTDLFRGGTVRAILAEVTAVLRAVTADPGTRLATLRAAVAGAAEQHRAGERRELRAVSATRLRQARRRALPAPDPGAG